MPTPVLISNLNQTESGADHEIGHLGFTANADAALAIPFRTGGNPSGYLLQGATVDIASVTKAGAGSFQGTLKASIHDDSGGTPGTEVHPQGGTTLMSGQTLGVTTLDADGLVVLLPDRRYWLVLELNDQTPGSIASLHTTGSQEADPGGEPGWSYGTESPYERFTSSSDWTQARSLSHRIKFAILGEALPNPPTLISNLGQTSDDSVRVVGNVSDQFGPNSVDRAQAIRFFTGANQDGYAVNGVQVAIPTVTNAASVKLKAAIYDDASGSPGSLVGTVGELTGPTAGILPIDADSDITLDADTYYWLVLELDDALAGSTINLSGTGSENLDPGRALSGWSLGSALQRWGANPPVNWTSAPRFKFALLGEPNPCAAPGITDTSAAVNIPDAALRSVIEAALGKNAGDTITYAELATVEEIRAENSGIASMEGLQYATGLKVLWLKDNRISSSISFCGLTRLERLFLSRNNIGGSIDLTGLNALRSVWIEHNRITRLWLPAAPNLHTMNANNNRLASVEFNGPLPDLETFDVWKNNLTEIDLTHVGATGTEDREAGRLGHLILADNNLTSLDIPATKGYVSVYAQDNELTSVTIPALKQLEVLNLRSNNLTSVTFGGNPPKLTYLDLGHNELRTEGRRNDEAVLWSGIRFSQLEILHLSGNKLDTLKFESNQVPKLARLYLDHNKDYKFALLNSEAFISLNRSNAPNLTYIDLRGNNGSASMVTSRCSSGMTCLY